MSGMDRRSFFKIVATAGPLRRPGAADSPPSSSSRTSSPPDNIVPGVPAYFATVCRECPSGCGVIAKNRDGRVVKLEGNPDHPVNSRRALRAGPGRLQALYHPDRFRGALSGGKPVAWARRGEAARGQARRAREGQAGRAHRGRERARDRQPRPPHGRVGAALGARTRIAYEPLGYESLRASNRIAFGRDAIPDYAIGEASYLVSFGADFLETWLNSEGYAVDFARMHAFFQGRPGRSCTSSRGMSLTAANADEWLRNAPGTEGALALAMLQGDRRRGPARAGGGSDHAARRGPRRRRRGGRDAPRAFPRRRSSTSPRISPRRRPGWCWAAAWPRPRRRPPTRSSRSTC